MKKAVAVLILATMLLSPLLLPGCGSKAQEGSEEQVANYAIENILVPKENDTSFIVEWRRKSTGPNDVSPDELAQAFWKWEGSKLVEISAEEYHALAAQRQGGDPKKWVYNEHSVTVQELDPGKGEAVVEIGSFYGPLTGAGVQYLLRREGGQWQKVSEETVWIT
ncbi:MAG: hypothetical protein A2V52_06465 [Actinobacteria bacterium RBG_19FT_COMBO_54_7]|uniref:Lipoprotein n=1 Tax=Candidatus Solincola sediminis TaxID=1797199 RepID=A0A1F2WJC5_9ACTN|nr:MAG: hypothetical protein A2Y75_07270 [Candidatus Solincola sediminis]OFW59653.1 MAG: hypothetical protein A2W01_01115 [Candidatus Solincola sediminis]OFW68475.1 MAG: hypothetical protein A2V52_06465 [Actinobacteria bacterium RBG_19FT_COMBO_54_7]